MAILAAEYGIEENGRQLETYSRVKLLPPGNPTPEQIAHHIARADLAHAYRPGLPDAADRAALVAAGRGCDSKRYLAALHRGTGNRNRPGGLPIPTPTMATVPLRLKCKGSSTLAELGQPPRLSPI